jgi:putative two-component system response regulator
VTSERPYKPAYPIEDALQILRDGRGTQFDPQVVDVFFDQLEQILAVVAEYQDKNDVLDGSVI